jgi:hypothetical protein
MAGALVFLSDFLRRPHLVRTRQWWVPVIVATLGLFLLPPTLIRTASTVQVAIAQPLAEQLAGPI